MLGFVATASVACRGYSTDSEQWAQSSANSLSGVSSSTRHSVRRRGSKWETSKDKGGQKRVKSGQSENEEELALLDLPPVSLEDGKVVTANASHLTHISGHSSRTIAEKQAMLHQALHYAIVEAKRGTGQTVDAVA